MKSKYRFHAVEFFPFKKYVNLKLSMKTILIQIKLRIVYIERE